MSPILSPGLVGIFVLIALRLSRVMLVTDRSRTVPLDVTIAKSKSGKMSKPLAADTFVTDVLLVPARLATPGT
jgi:hypothetical protein